MPQIPGRNRRQRHQRCRHGHALRIGSEISRQPRTKAERLRQGFGIHCPDRHVVSDARSTGVRIYRGLRCQHPLLRTGRSCPCLCSPERSGPSNRGSPGPRHAFLRPGDSRTVPDRHSPPERSRCSRRIRRRLQSLFKCQADRRD